MKKKTYIIIVILIVSVLSIKPLRDFSSNLFWNFVASQFEREEQNRLKKVETGKVVRGRDTILMWGDVYEIKKTASNINLTISSQEGDKTVLSGIKDHKIIQKRLYIISTEGYAVIDKDNKCRIFIIIPAVDFENGYSTDEQGNRVYYSRRCQNQNVEYLSNIDDFSDEEQKIIEELTNENL